MLTASHKWSPQREHDQTDQTPNKQSILLPGEHHFSPRWNRARKDECRRRDPRHRTCTKLTNDINARLERTDVSLVHSDLRSEVENLLEDSEGEL
jgi:hypothetical protein